MRILDPIREFFRKGDVLLLLLCLVASLFGLVLIYSATRYLNYNRYVIVQAIAICLGVVLYIVLSFLDIEYFVEKMWKWLMAFNILFILLILTPLGKDVGGNRSWLDLGLPMNIQPAEIVKLSFILLLSWQIVRIQEHKDISSMFSIMRIGGHAFFMVGLIVAVSSDFGMALIYVAIFCILAWTSGVKLRWFAAAGFLILLAVGLALLFLPTMDIWDTNYQIMRFRVIFDHTLDPQGVGFHQMRSILAIGSGQLFGQGYLHGIQTQSTYSSALPDRHTDFIFAVCGEEFGIIGCIAVILLLAAIIVRCVSVSRRAHSHLSAFVAMGFAGMLLFQMLLNIGMCLFVMPVVGLTLPFFSYGGSSIITMFASMGIVSGIKMRSLPDWLKDRNQL